MAGSNEISKEVQESIREAVDRQVKFSLKKLVKMEIRSDRIETRIVACSAFRLFILTPKVPSKLENSFHFLEIQSIESNKPNQLTLVVDGKVNHFLRDGSAEDIDHIILHIGISLKNIFPLYPLERFIKKVEVQPVDRLKPMHDMMATMEKKNIGSCGGFTTMYQCMCDFHGQPMRDEVVWDIDTIYLSHDSRELRLQDFDHLSGKDLIPIIGALEHNTWFKQLNASNVKLTLEASSVLLKVIKLNAILEELNLSNTGIKMDFVQKLSMAITSNSGSQLNSIDLSNNPLDDKAIYHLLGAIKHLSSGLTSFDLSKTCISTKCLNKVGEMLAQSANVIMALKILKLNDNLVRGEDVLGLYSFFAQPNAITYLDLSGTDCTLDTLCDPLLRGCSNLTVLKASRTAFTRRKTKEVVIPNSWKQFFASSCCLEHVDFSNCKLPSEALKELLMGVTCSRSIKDLYLDINSNELGVAGASVIASCFSQIKGIKTLDISNNGLDTEMKSILSEIAKNPHLKSLLIGRNFTNIRPKNLPEVMNGVVQMLQEETCLLESLSLADSKLKSDTTYVINALGSNNVLVEIDISGNAMGDFGARMLAKALLINTKLQKVVWDRNNITVTGFEDVAEALKKNMTLKEMPISVNDAVVAMGLSPKKTEVALQKIESYLQRNNNPRRFASDQAYRLQQGFIITSTQQVIDKLVVNIEDTIEALKKYDSIDAYGSEVKAAELLIVDANKSKQLLPGLQDISMKSQASGNPIGKQLSTMSVQLKDVIKEHLQKTVEEMLNCAKSYCPAVMNKQSFEKLLQEGCQSKLSSLPKDFARGVLEGASTDIYNTASEMNLSVAALISDGVLEEIIDSLTATLKSLSNHLCLRRSGLYVADKQEVKEVEEKQEFTISLEVEENPNELTNKRRTILQRKQRPQSTMGTDHLVLGTKIISDVPKSNENNIGKVQVNSASDFSDLTAPSQRLEHVTKARPRREKVHRPTRPIHMQGSVDMEEQPNNGPSIQKQMSFSESTDEQTKLNSQDPKKKSDDVSSNDIQKMQKKVKDTKETKKGVFGNIFRKKEDKKKLSSTPVPSKAISSQGSVEKPPDNIPEPATEDTSSTYETGAGAFEKLVAPPRFKHTVAQDRVAILPPSKKMEAPLASSIAIEEISQPKIDLSEKAEKKEEKVKPLVPSIAKPTLLSGKYIQEIKDKQSSKVATAAPENESRNVKFVAETNNNVKDVDVKMSLYELHDEEMSGEVKTDQHNNYRKLAHETAQLKRTEPIKRPVSSIEDHVQSESIAKSLTTPDLTHPEVPVKPRPPPPPKPSKPTSFRNSNPDESKERENSPSESAPSEGIVYDSATLRLPVKEKIKRISQGLAMKDNSSHLSGNRDSTSSQELREHNRSSDSSIRNSVEKQSTELEIPDQPNQPFGQKEDEIMV